MYGGKRTENYIMYKYVLFLLGRFVEECNDRLIGNISLSSLAFYTFQQFSVYRAARVSVQLFRNFRSLRKY